uniref:Ig-like domain-containing protein n=1 Tax=Seriola dumerili TaxID=41447 RepID=A0A3B4U9M5_SERDU
ETEITSEAGLCVVIPCSFTVAAGFDVKSVIWYKCDPADKKDCKSDTPIFNSSNNGNAQSGFRGQVSQLEPDMSQKNCSIIINDLMESDSGSYRLRVTGPPNQKTDDCTFNSKATIKPEVTIPPLTEGQQTTLTCTAPGLCSGSDPQITWTWRGAGEKGSHITGNITDFKTESLSAVTQKHSSNLTFNPSAEHHGTSVTCKVSFTGNAATEETVTLNVTYVPRVEIKKTSPMSDVKEGDKMFLICNVIRSYPQPSTYNWFKNGTHIDQKQSYVVETIKPENRGSYTCEATNDVGTGTSKPLLISVQCKFHTIPVLYAFTCNTDANPEPHTYSWHRYSQNKQIDSSRWKSSTGHDNSQYLASVQRADEACYTCNATNSIGTGDDSQPVCIDVLYPPTEPTLSMADEVTEGHTVTITCTVESNPPSTLTLRRTSTSNPQFLEIHKSINDQPHVSTLHHFFNVTSADTGSYSCRAVNSEGSKESKQRKLLVKYIPKDVTVKPLSGLIVNENAPLKLSCDAQSYPSVTSFTWRKTDGNHETHQTTQTLTIKSASPSDSGLYSCEATNEIGTGKSQPVQVQIKYSPKSTSVSVRPSGPVPEDTNVTLTCTSDAKPAVRSYTWYRADGGQETFIGTGQTLNIRASKLTAAFICMAENSLGAGRSNIRQIDFTVTLPKTIEVLKGSCVTIPCSFEITSTYQNDLDNTCKAIWKNIDENIYSSDNPKLTTTKEMTGDLTRKDCTTTFNNMHLDHTNDYYFRLHCDNPLKWTFQDVSVNILVKGMFLYLFTHNS